MTVPLFQIDAFTDRAFSGNPAAVALLDHEAGEAWMQAVAAEMNLSETAFVVPRSDGTFGLRWFTPTTEVALCGHATVAAAHALWSEGRVAPDEVVTFATASGLLGAAPDGALIWLDLPADPPVATDPPAELVAALGVEPVRVGSGAMWVVEVATEAEVRAAAPDLRRLAAFPPCLVTALADDGAAFNIVLRCFGPGVGIDEDPVTGSAQCLLGPWWAPRLGRTDFVAHQASARGGTVRVRVEGDRVRVGGAAVTVLRGALVV